MRGTEVAKLIRKELKGVFPNQKFSVRNRGGSMSDAIHVSWMDGVALDPVRTKVRKFSRVDHDDVTGEILGGGNTFVFAEREVSEANKKKIEAKIRKQSGFSSAFSDWERERIIQQRVWEKLNQTSFN